MPTPPAKSGITTLTVLSGSICVGFAVNTPAASIAITAISATPAAAIAAMAAVLIRLAPDETARAALSLSPDSIRKSSLAVAGRRDLSASSAFIRAFSAFFIMRTPSLDGAAISPPLCLRGALPVIIL